MAEGGFKRWIQDLDMGGGPAHFADLLAEEYVLSEFDTSFAKLDQEQRNQRGAEMTILLAMIAAPLIDTAVYGRAPSPNDRYNPNSRLDNIEQEGWSIKGPQSYIESPEVAGYPDGAAGSVGNPGGQVIGTGKVMIPKASELTSSQTVQNKMNDFVKIMAIQRRSYKTLY